MRYLIISFVLLVVAKANPVAFNDCGSLYDLQIVDIEGCENWSCSVQIGGEITISMEFKTSFVSQKLHQDVQIMLMGLLSPLEVTPEDPCSNLTCPVASGSISRFSTKVTLDSSLIPVVGTIRSVMKNEQNQQVICMETDLELHW